MQILLINSDGDGWVSKCDVSTGTTVSDFLAGLDHEWRYQFPEQYLIKLNRELCAVDAQLADGDRLSITSKVIRATPGRPPKDWREKHGLRDDYTMEEFTAALKRSQEENGSGSRTAQ